MGVMRDPRLIFLVFFFHKTTVLPCWTAAPEMLVDARLASGGVPRSCRGGCKAQKPPASGSRLLSCRGRGWMFNLRSREQAPCQGQCQAHGSTPALQEKGAAGKPAPGCGERGQRPLPLLGFAFIFLNAFIAMPLAWKPRQPEKKERRIKINTINK